MSPSILMLASQSEQDKELVGNPSISFFKYMYRRHTNFAINTHELLSDDFVDWGKKVFFTISRKGDLLGSMYLQIKIPPLRSSNRNPNGEWVSNLGHVLINKIELQIAGTTIDSHTGEWLYIQNQLTTPVTKKNGVDYMIGYEVFPSEEKVMYIPLHFWFNRHHGEALPIAAMPLHDMKIHINLKNFNEVAVNADTKVPIDISLLSDFIILDIPERKNVIKQRHVKLIEQVQTNMSNTTTNLRTSIDMLFKNTVKEIIWTVQRSDSLMEDSKRWFNFSYKYSKNPIKHVTIRFNGNDLLTEFPGEYFNLVQPYQYHSNIPENTGICVYSFSLFPEQQQPSGHVNFSSLDNASLELEFQPDYFDDPLTNFVDANVKIYAVSYNIFVIENGVGALKYA